MQRFHLMRFVDNVRRPLGIFEGDSLTDAVTKAAAAHGLLRTDIDIVLDDLEREDVHTIERLEDARAAGATIIAVETQHGRPDQWHVVGNETKRPLYTCEPFCYEILWPEGVNADRKWGA